jgi:hypothetical protein
VYKILLESQVKEKPIAYTKWGKCLKKDRMHTLTCINGNLFTSYYHAKNCYKVKEKTASVPPVSKLSGHPVTHMYI